MKIVLILLLLPQIAFCQNNKLEAFGNLMNKTWEAEGKWGDGSVFKQRISFEYSLDSTIIIANTKGFTDKERNSFGNRNHGIRKYNKQLDKVEFWEFDIFGGTTKGFVSSSNKNLLYQYEYGGTFISEYWEYLDDSTYNFKIGDCQDGVWKQVYLSTQFKRSQNLSLESIYSVLKENLNGHWTSEAWDGRLNESWTTDDNGHLLQTAQYIEDNRVLFESTNKIEVIDNELILMSVIKGSNPKIFKASSYSESEIVFENSDYINPNKVVYNFGPEEQFQREISGRENDQPTSYIFHFKKIE